MFVGVDLRSFPGIEDARLVGADLGPDGEPVFVTEVEKSDDR